QSTLQLTALALVVFLTRSVVFAVLAMAAISASVLFAYDLRSARLVLGLGGHRRSRAQALAETLRALRPRWEARTLRKLVWLGLPLGLVTGLNNLTTSVPRYLLAGSHGE